MVDDGLRATAPLLLEAAVTGSADAAFTLPTGTVTFLMTDVEGSTRRWQVAPESMAVAIPRQFEILAEVIEQHHGVRPVEQGEGDSVVGAFSRASDAVAAAAMAQRLLAAEPWPEGAELRVRMAVHTGEAQLRNAGNYVSFTLNRCARIRVTGFGGQVLVSATTAALVADRLPAGATLLDLGQHRLKDLGRPEQILQLVLDDVPSQFPPLKSLDGFRHNLPVQLTPFIGRLQDVANVRQRLAGERLVTLTGSGGVGKTRLALTAAADRIDQYPGGVWFVELASVSDPAAVGRAALAALGSPLLQGASPAQQLAVELGDAPTLLVLDNCEHLVEACAELVATLLVTNPAVTVLATSREPLGVPGEVISRVPSMSCPTAEVSTAPAALSQYDAVTLFIDRAHRARPTFAVSDANAPAVAQICARLDGIPLAIELAAARCRQLPVERIAAELDDRFRLLTGGARTVIARQQTLLASIEWSHDRLDEAERLAFRRLGVFAGAFPVDAAEAVVAAVGGVERVEVFDVICRLVDKSLVIADEDDVREPRYRLLESLQKYAVDQCKTAGELSAARDAHADWWAEWLVTRGEQAGDDFVDDVVRYHEGIRAALEWAASDPLTGLRFLGRVAGPWTLTGRLADAGPAFERLLTPVVAEQWPAEWLAAASRASWVVMVTHGPIHYWAFLDLFEAVATKAGDADSLALARFGRADSEDWPAALKVARQRSDDILVVNLIRFGASDAAERTPSDGFALWEQLEREATPQQRAYLRPRAGVVRAVLHNAEGDLRAGLREALASVDQPANLEHTIRELGFAGLLARDEPALRRAAEAAERYIRMSPGGRELVDLAIHRYHLLLGEPARVDASLLPDVKAWGATHETLWLVGREAIDAGDPQMAVEGCHRRKLGDEPHRNAVMAAIEGAATGDEDRWHEALRLAIVHGYRLVAVDAFEGLAAAAARTESWAEALRLLGAAERLREETGYAWRFGFEERAVVSAREAALAALGDAGEAALAAGRGLDWHEAAEYAARARGERKRPSHGWESLTPTERQVVALVAEGLSNPQIAERLLMSRATVKTHLVHVFTKLGMKTRAELAAEATRRRASMS